MTPSVLADTMDGKRCEGTAGPAIGTGHSTTRLLGGGVLRLRRQPLVGRDVSRPEVSRRRLECVEVVAPRRLFLPEQDEQRTAVRGDLVADPVAGGARSADPRGRSRAGCRTAR